jgi:hypothetical protein
MGLFRKSAKKTEHEYVEEQLSAYIDGELSAQERDKVERHLATCEDCRWNLDTLRQTVQWTAELPTVPVPRVFTIPVPAEPERAPRWRWSLPVLQGATALAALLLVFAFAGDFMLSAVLPGAAPEPARFMEQAVDDVAVTEAAAEKVVETVVVEKEVEAVGEAPAAPTEEAVPEAEKAALEPSPVPAPAEVEVTKEVELEVEVTSTATDEASAMGAAGFESPPPGAQDVVTETEGAEEARVAPPEATLTEAAYAATDVQPTATMLPTATPTTPPPPPAPTELPTLAEPTALAELPQRAVAPIERAPAGETWREPVDAGLDVAKVVLMVVFILLATSTAAVMVRRRRIG